MTKLRILLFLVCCTFAPVQAADTQALFERALILLDSKRYFEAIPLLKDVLVADPKSPGVLWNLGLAAAETEQPSSCGAYDAV